MDGTENTKFNNCYSYAFREYDPNATEKRIPGNVDVPYTCSKMIYSVIQDHPNIKLQKSAKEPCPDGYYKVFLALDERASTQDFHFWRQECDGMWTHKPGPSCPSAEDGSNHPIFDPEKSDRHLGKYQYDKSCGYFCVPE